MSTNDRYLAIDYGTVRIGLALTDPLKMTAQPLEFLPNTDKLVQSLEKIIREQNISRIILGHPIQLSGAEGIASQKIKKFAEVLKKKFTGTQVILLDERMTTAEAEKILISADVSREKRKAKIDSLAAALLLESYLEGKKK